MIIQIDVPSASAAYFKSVMCVILKGTCQENEDIAKAFESGYEQAINVKSVNFEPLKDD